jgi:hypothetical protein
MSRSEKSKDALIGNLQKREHEVKKSLVNTKHKALNIQSQVRSLFYLIHKSTSNSLDSIFENNLPKRKIVLGRMLPAEHGRSIKTETETPGCNTKIFPISTSGELATFELSLSSEQYFDQLKNHFVKKFKNGKFQQPLVIIKQLLAYKFLLELSRASPRNFPTKFPTFTKLYMEIVNEINFGCNGPVFGKTKFQKMLEEFKKYKYYHLDPCLKVKS